MIEGSLRNLPLTDVFQTIVASQKTGILTLLAGIHRARIYFEQGRIQYAHLSPGVHLGEVMVRMDLLTTLEVQDLLRRQDHENPGTPLGLLAVHRGLIDPEDLGRALERQVLEVLVDVIAWRDGEFSFTDRSASATQVPTEHTYDAMQLLMEVIQRLDDYEEGAVDPDTVYRRAGDPTKVDMPLGGWEVLSVVDGRRTARSAAAEIDMAERQVYHLLHVLESRGVIAPVAFDIHEPVVLVVSPSSALQRLLRLALQRARLSPEIALDVDDALERAGRERPSAVVVDEQDGDGWELVREIRDLPGMAHVPIVVLVEEEAGFFARLRRPKAHTLRKPFAELEFQQLVTGLVGRSIG